MYDLPVGRGKKFGSAMSGVADKIVGGWQIATVLAFRSGLPIMIATNNNALQGLGFGRAAPNLVSTKLLNPPNRTPNNWFNGCTQVANPDGTTSRFDCAANQPVAWTLPGDFQVGNAPRFISNLRTDWTRNTDLSLAKYFQLSERFRLQFRSDFINAWNTPAFASPDSYITSGTAGQMFGTSNNPRNIQFALKLEF